MLQRAAEAGVTGILVPAVDPSGWPRVRALRSPASPLRVWVALGTHPHALPRTLTQLGVSLDPSRTPDGSLTPETLASLVPADIAGLDAIGECGLDAGVPVPLTLQEAVLAAHLHAARAAALPVILHCVRAHDRMLRVLRGFAPVRGVLHSCSASAELVPAYVALGLHLWCGGAVTGPGARRPVAALRACPRERLLAETDAPDQCPAPERGRSEPAHLPVVVRAMEHHRGESLADALIANASALGW